MIVESILLIAIGVISMAVMLAIVPRCPECGSTQVAQQWHLGRIWICENCENVFRQRRRKPMHFGRKELK